MDPTLPSRLDCANHHPNATPKDIEELCQKVLQYGFNSAFVNPVYVPLAKKLLSNKAKVGTVVSFPLGQDTLPAKIAIANSAVDQGADELDVVPNLGAFLSGDRNGFLSEMAGIVEGARMLGRPVIVKFILDPGYFDSLPDKKERMQDAARLIQQSGADFVKIGSGMGPRVPEVQDVTIVREAVGPEMKIKVAGGIDTLEEAERFIAAGANRIGTSKAVDIVTQNKLAEKSMGATRE